MIKKIAISFCLLLLFTNVYSQDRYKIAFDGTHFLLDDMSEAVALYKFSGKSFKYENESYEVKFPENFDMEDTAFAFIFFQGWKNAPIADETLVLIGNYKQSPTVIVDANNNLDFSDDAATQLSSLNETLRFKLFNSEHKDAFCLVEMGKIVYKDNERKKKSEHFIAANPAFNKNEAVSADNWLSVKRINYVTARSAIANDSVYIGLVDGTGNGLFDDLQWDRVMVGDYQTESISDEFSEGGYIIEKDLNIQINGKTYVVKEVDPTGRFLELETSDIVSARLEEGSVVPDFAFQDMEGNQQSLYDYLSDNPFILLDFWGTWCKPCIANIPKLKKISSEFSQLAIIGLDAHDQEDKAKAFVEKNKLHWHNGFATEEMLKTLRVDHFPYYVLIGKDGKIIKLNADLNELNELLLKFD